MTHPHVDLFIRCLWDVLLREARILEGCADRFPVPSIMFIDEVTFAYLACKAFLLVSDEEIVVRKEQWVGGRAGMSGKRCDIVLGDRESVRHWIELKVWKPGRAPSFNRAQIRKDMTKLHNQVEAGLPTVQTYADCIRLTIPQDCTRQVVVLRAEREALSGDAWTLMFNGEEQEPTEVLTEKVGSWNLYVAVYGVGGAALTA